MYVVLLVLRKTVDEERRLAAARAGNALLENTAAEVGIDQPTHRVADRPAQGIVGYLRPSGSRERLVLEYLLHAFS